MITKGNALVDREVFKDVLRILASIILFIAMAIIGIHLSNISRDKSKDVKYYHVMVIWDHYIVSDTITTDTSYTQQQYNSLFGKEDVYFICNQIH